MARVAERTGGDAGDTLVEVLVAVTILGIAVVALLAGLIVALGSSTTHRTLTNLDTVVRSFAETAEYQIELQATPLYQDCATVAGTSYSGNSIAFSAPAGYSVAFSGIQYWNSTTQQFDPNGGVCGASDQSGYQLLTVKADSPSGATESLSFAVRTST